MSKRREVFFFPRHMLLAGIVFFILLSSFFIDEGKEEKSLSSALPSKTFSPDPSLTAPSDTPVPSPRVYQPQQVRSPVQDTAQQEEWGKAKQVGEHTWTMKVGEDEAMATPQEVFEALNVYRSTKGKGTLSWDGRLAEYAQQRAEYFALQKQLDEHAGFNNYLQQQDGFVALGFAALGENSSIGYRLSGVHLIEWIYAGDEPHDQNQLSDKWSHVGIGVSGTATNLIFGGKKM